MVVRIGVNALQLAARNSGVGQYIYQMVLSLLESSTDQFQIYSSRDVPPVELVIETQCGYQRNSFPQGTVDLAKSV